MTEDTTIAAVLVLVVALVAAPVAAAAPTGGPAATYGAQDTETPDQRADENATVQPGEKLTGVVNVQGAEIEGEVDERTFGVKVARAKGNASKADVVADQLDDVERRITELEERKQRLQDARENGSISEGEYRAEMAEVAAELETAKRLANASESTANGLPADVLADKGINVSAIQTLKDRAGNLSGPEVAAIAQSIAGRDVGQSMAGAKKPDEVGAQLPDEAGNRSGGSDEGQGSGQDGADGSQGGQQDGQDGAGSQQGDDADGSDAADAIDSAEQAVASAQERLDRADETVTDDSSDAAKAALERAEENVTAARQALEDARDASDNGDDQRAAELADEAYEHAQAALEHAQTAIDEAQGGSGQGGSGQSGQGA